MSSDRVDAYLSMGSKNIEELIERSWIEGKNGTNRIAKVVVFEPEVLKDLIDVFTNPESKVRKRSAWLLDHVYRIDPAVLQEYLDKLLKGLSHDPPGSVRRCTTRIFSFEKLKEEWLDDLSFHCFAYLENAQEEIAVRVFSMTILFHICEQVPELKNELIYLLEEHLEYGSAGFKNRATKILKKLR